MKDIDIISIPVTRSLEQETVRRSRWNDYYELTKPRLSMLSVITALFGYLAARPERNWVEMLGLMAGTSLAAGGAAVLNEWIERREDALMKRTASRPIPSGTITPKAALIFGCFLAITGPALIWACASLLPALLTVATLAGYLLVYTPLKKRTEWNTEIGAVPGALPPLIGYAGAGLGLGAQAWYLFGILFVWQMVHFMAISWNYREDYKRGGFRMISLADDTGKRTSRRALVYAILLFILTLVPLAYGWAGFIYGVGATVLSAWLFWQSLQFYHQTNKTPAAKRLFWASIAHLPLFLLVLTIDQYFFL